MNILCMFGIGSKRIQSKNCCVSTTITQVRNSYLYVIKKPVRIGNTDENTKFSHFIDFTYTVDGTPYRGSLFLTPYSRCPKTGEEIQVYYDPENPKNYACYPFGPGVNPIGW